MNGFSDAHFNRLAAAEQGRVDRQDRTSLLADQMANNPDYDPAAPDNLLEALGEFTAEHWKAIGSHINASWVYCSNPAKEQVELAAIGRLIRNFSETYQNERVDEAVRKMTGGNDD